MRSHSRHYIGRLARTSNSIIRCSVRIQWFTTVRPHSWHYIAIFSTKSGHLRLCDHIHDTLSRECTESSKCQIKCHMLSFNVGIGPTKRYLKWQKTCDMIGHMIRRIKILRDIKNKHDFLFLYYNPLKLFTNISVKTCHIDMRRIQWRMMCCACVVIFRRVRTTHGYVKRHIENMHLFWV